MKVAIESCHLPLPDWNFLNSTLSHIISSDHMHGKFLIPKFLLFIFNSFWPSDNCHQLRHRSYMQASIAKSPPGVVTCIGPLALGNLFSFASMQLMGLLENLLKQCMGYGYEPINFIHTTLHTWLVFRFCTWPSKAPRLQCISGLADSLTCTASSVGRNAGLTACKAA